MTARCEPPPGTPDGTVCWLKSKEGRYMALEWRGGYFIDVSAWIAGYHAFPTFELASLRDGWQFHSIATTPEGDAP